MKTKNQTGHTLLELALAKAANEEGFSQAATRDAASTGKQTDKQTWSPLEVWRTRVKNAGQLNRSEPA
jgi:hypothetical protein